jgi:hypothetical protein
MTAVSFVCERARTHFTANARDALTTLNGAINSSVTTVTVVSSTGITAGSLIDVDAETMYVADVPTSTTLTVIRGQRASDAAAHSSGVVVRINPKVHTSDLLLALNDELADLSSPSCGLFRPEIVEITSTASLSIDLAATGELIDVLSVRYHDTTDRWVYVPSWTAVKRPVSASFTAGWELRLNARIGRSLEVTCATDFIPVADYNDDVEGTSGLPDTALDLLAIGMALRVGLGREIARNFIDSQGDTRRSEEVPAGANASAPAALRALRQRRIFGEVSRLETRYPRQVRNG